MARDVARIERLIASARSALDMVEAEVRLHRRLGGPVPAVLVAKGLYAERRLRGVFFDPALFREPAWDMLLTLFIAAVEGREVSTARLTDAAGLPGSTALRWIRRLEDEELVERSYTGRDERLSLVAISDEGYRRMATCLERMADGGEGP